jgi:pimeloyl-ACP methyl ester carboxylesterase
MSLDSDRPLKSLRRPLPVTGKIIPIFITLTVVLLLTLSCGFQLLDYSLDTPATTLSVLGAPGTKDGRARFRQIFCDRLAADPEFGTEKGTTCETYLLRLEDETKPTAPAKPLPQLVPRLRILIVPGFMGACYWDFAKPFEVSAAHLNARGYRIDWIVVDGRSGSEHNGGQIANAVRRLHLEEDESLVLVGHSKGAVDILDFLVSYPDLASRVAAVVSVSGAINGSPLADYLVNVYAALEGLITPSDCPRGDDRAVESQERVVRLSWLASHRLPDSVRYFSMVSFTQGENVNTILREGYDMLKTIDPRNDGVLLFYDQVVPGATLLGYANGDHWATAYPLEEKHPTLTKTFFLHNHYPRTALLEAMALYVAEALKTKGINDETALVTGSGPTPEDPRLRP